MDDKTVEQCRSAFFLSDLVNRKGYGAWQADGHKRIDEKAAEAYRLASGS